MARSRRKNGGPTRGRFKLQKLGKGYAAQRKQPYQNAPIIKDPEAHAAAISAAK